MKIFGVPSKEINIKYELKSHKMCETFFENRLLENVDLLCYENCFIKLNSMNLFSTTLFF